MNNAEYTDYLKTIVHGSCSTGKAAEQLPVFALWNYESDGIEFLTYIFVSLGKQAIF